MANERNHTFKQIILILLGNEFVPTMSKGQRDYIKAEMEKARCDLARLREQNEINNQKLLSRNDLLSGKANGKKDRET